MNSHSFDREAGVTTFFKCENMQNGGAFKFRGAANFIYSIPEQDRARGVVAFSSGNHAQAVAIAAQSLGIPATLAMPLDAPALESGGDAGSRREDRYLRPLPRGSRRDRQKAGGGNRRDASSALRSSLDYRRPRHGGAGTDSKRSPDLDAIVVCIGGGGLMSGSVDRGQEPASRVFA